MKINHKVITIQTRVWRHLIDPKSDSRRQSKVEHRTASQNQGKANFFSRLLTTTSKQQKGCT
jgi:hypothetical protein